MIHLRFAFRERPAVTVSCLAARPGEARGIRVAVGSVGVRRSGSRRRTGCGGRGAAHLIPATLAAASRITAVPRARDRFRMARRRTSPTSVEVLVGRAVREAVIAGPPPRHRGRLKPARGWTRQSIDHRDTGLPCRSRRAAGARGDGRFIHANPELAHAEARDLGVPRGGPHGPISAWSWRPVSLAWRLRFGRRSGESAGPRPWARGQL